MMLFLDDYRQPEDCLDYMHKRIGAESSIYDNSTWKIVRNYPEFIAWIKKYGVPSIISFDHDLADGHYHKNMQQGVINYKSESFNDDYNKTGYHCAMWLVEHCITNNLELPVWYVHSMNPVGSKNIVDAFNAYYKYKLNEGVSRKEL